MRPTLALLAAIAVLATLPAATSAYPPITCGRVVVAGKTYVFRTHGPTCAFATRWLKAVLNHRHGPKSYRCRSYGADVPAYCKNTRHRYRFRYFLASPAS